MAKVTFNVHKSFGLLGDREMHYGYICEIGPEGQLFADIPADMLQNELDNGRVTLVAESKPKGDALEDKSKAELQAILDGLKVAYTVNTNKADLAELIRGARKDSE